ncbi:MAG: hypothetical protein IJE43_13540 [Alphaproteobacteria bacterium]|nr:hypothetical protein [Alphaproteobacteria bacterium]
MEIGSFIELQYPKGQEYYGDSNNIVRLNSGRAAIWHAFRVLGCDLIWLPYYQCDTVRQFLQRKNVKIKYYHIDEFFNPIDLKPRNDEAVLIVNYFGIMSDSRMKELASFYQNVIIDNSQAFFAKPIETCMSVYSARKFVGVPDGAYVIGENARTYVDEYPQGYSSDTANFLLQRIEYGCEGKTYSSRMINERRIDGEDIMKMSKLTRYILDGTDYENIKSKRKENYQLASDLFGDINKLDTNLYYSDECVPMVYPLVVEDDTLLEKLLQHKHFQGHWWSYILDELDGEHFEYWISRYIIPITIDQRYGKEELNHIKRIIE